MDYLKATAELRKKISLTKLVITSEVIKSSNILKTNSQ